MEGLIPSLYGADAVEIPGSRTLLSSLTSASVPWAIVTSGTTPLVTGWLKILDLPKPEHLIVAEDVTHGKPDPQGYLMGSHALGLVREGLRGEVLVLEDSPAGIKAGKAAGCRVLAVTTTHTAEEVKRAGADWVVRDLRSVRVVATVEEGKSVVLEIRDGLVGN
jgi:glycerol 3-phosphatase-1